MPDKDKVIRTPYPIHIQLLMAHTHSFITICRNEKAVILDFFWLAAAFGSFLCTHILQEDILKGL